jgi:hypothetical protein
MTGFHKFTRGLQVMVVAGALQIWPVAAFFQVRISGILFIRTFIPVDTKPVKAIDKISKAFFSASNLVSIFNPEDK